MDKEDLIFLGVSSVIGALTGLGLSFTALTPLVIGGIVSFIPLALLTALCVGKLLYKFCKENKIEEDHKSAAIGVGLAAAISAIFPGAMFERDLQL